MDFAETIGNTIVIIASVGWTIRIFYEIFSDFHSTFSHPNNPNFRCFESNKLKISDLKNILKRYMVTFLEDIMYYLIIYEGCNVFS